LGWLDNRGTGDMARKGRLRNTRRDMNPHRTLTPKVRLDIVGTPGSIDENPGMAVIGRRKNLLDTGKNLPMENEELRKHQRKSMSCMEVG
jgi:hypothetical protein